MKLFGQIVKGPNIETLVLPRADFDIVISAQAILNTDTFDALCPRPRPPKIHRPGQTDFEELPSDPSYLKILENWAKKRTAWTVLESLRATPTTVLEWETTKYDMPETWAGWQDELRAAFFTESELIAIMNVVWAANGMNQQRLDEARNRFLAGEVRAPKAPVCPTAEVPSTPAGEPANDSV